MNKVYDIKKDPELSESYYFNFYDSKSKTGCIIRLSSHPNKKIRRLLIVIFNKRGLYIKNDKTLLLNSKLTSDKFSIDTQTKKNTKVKYDGEVYKYDPLKFPNLISLFTRKKYNVKFDLSFFTSSRKIDYSKYAIKELIPILGTVRYEIACKIKGTIRINGRTFEINTSGMRDYAYGPRRWNKIDSWLWTHFTLDNKTYSFADVDIRSNKYVIGFKIDRQKVQILKNVEISKEIDSSNRHNNISIKFVENNVKKEIKGKVLYHIRLPIVFSKNPLKILFLKFIQVFYVIGLTKFTLSGKSCFSYSEVLINK